ncbi:hypothetical protein HK099_007557 [Clydaea vesicula]|uniref:SS18 N-terminal domain-containing protein n=1 Tax=Clydaea vesicula TaxID=447962 RepID=A0AAD5TYT6_9FUNG|nr:hypothetical protein HK099_007557 [Clydaea vesicula]
MSKLNLNLPSPNATMVPELNSHTLSILLQTNKQIIKILVDYQANGWTNDPEYIQYQKRLAMNLQYLAAVANTSTTKPIAAFIPPITPVLIPEKLKNFQQQESLKKSNSNNNTTNNSSVTSKNLTEIVESLNPPLMVGNSNNNNATSNKASSNSENVYVPVPPFILPADADLNIVKPITSINKFAGSTSTTVISVNNKNELPPTKMIIAPTIENTSVWEEEQKVKNLILKKISSYGASLDEEITFDDNNVKFNEVQEEEGGPLEDEEEDEQSNLAEEEPLLTTALNDEEDGDYKPKNEFFDTNSDLFDFNF